MQNCVRLLAATGRWEPRLASALGPSWARVNGAGVLGLGRVNQLSEGIEVGDGQIGEHLAIDLDIGLLE
jgi:hypothetical protein